MLFDKVVGIGGIGAGMLFLTDDNTTLGRSESRLVELSDAKDYCKLHIVFHYVAELLGNNASVYPIGFVGKDAHGNSLLEEINEAGMDSAYISSDLHLPTMLSIVLQYPDKETCNFTASNSACDKVTALYVKECMEQIGIDHFTIVAAIPEVQAESRIEMLRYGKEKGAFCCLSIPESEADVFKSSGIFDCCSLLAVNYSEALALCPCDGDEAETAKHLFADLQSYNPEIMLMVTCGEKGSLTIHKGNLEYVPPIPADVFVTTGAGDACLGGVIAGLAMGLPFQKGNNDTTFGETPLASALELGCLCAGMAIEKADSIAKHVGVSSIMERIRENGWKKESRFLAKESENRG